MIQAIKKEVTIQPGGRIEITSPELKPGMRAEVVVMITDSQYKFNRLTSFIGKGKGSFASPSEADAFIRKERDTWE